MTDEKNTRNATPETAKPEPTLTNPVEQSFAEAERLAEQAEAAAKDEPCCDMPKAEEAAPEAPKTEVPTPPQYQPPQYQPPQYTYAAYTAQPQQPTPQEGAGDYRPPRYTEQYQANANNANYNNPQQTYYAPNGQPQYGQNYAQPYDPPQGTKSRIAAGVLAILFGVFGVHNFYIGKTGLGIAQLAITVCSCGTLAIVSEIWGIIEGVRLLQGTIYTDGHGMKFVD